MSTLLITGASGYLAQILVPLAAQRATVIGIARDARRVPACAQALSLDLGDRAALLEAISAWRPDAIIHAAACNPGDGDAGVMQATNVVASRHVAQAAARTGTRLVAVSSDTVFDGRAAPYADAATPTPLPDNVYALTKAAGEAAVLQHCPDAVIARTSLIYGLEHMDRGTAGFKARLEQGESLQLFTDVLRQPVHDRALARGLLQLALDLQDECGTLNLAGEEVLSRHDFARRMLAYWNIDDTGPVVSRSARNLPGVPLDCRLRLDRAGMLGLATPGVSEVLDKTTASSPGNTVH